MVNPPRSKIEKSTGGPSDVPRPQLVRLLDQGLAGKVTLVSAPAGYGKSTLIRSWLSHIESTSESPAEPLCKSSWLSLSDEDDGVPGFVVHLVSAIHQGFPECCQGVIQLVQEGPQPDIEAIADRLVRCLGQPAHRLVLVLDDMHYVTDAAICAFLTRLVQFAPPQLHMVLISRVDPPLPLNRWRTQGILNEVRLRDLSFNLAETTTFLRGHLDVEPDSSLIEALHQRTEGWPAGLRLAIIALRRCSDYAEFASRFRTTNTRYIADYLVDEVLEQQTPSAQEFLVKTAILDRFSVELCASVLEISEIEAQQGIKRLEQENTFLIGLSPTAHWYRYHQQFRDLLISRLHMRYDQMTVASLRRRAAAWLATHDQVGEALRQLATVDDYDAAADLVEGHRIAAMNRFRVSDLDTWLSQLPPQVVRKRLCLLLSLAWVRLHQVEKQQCLTVVERAASLLGEVGAALPERKKHLYEAELIALRTSLDPSPSHDEAVRQIRSCWQKLQPHVSAAHCNLVLLLAHTSHRLGDLDLALAIVSGEIEDALEWPVIARCRLYHAAAFFRYCQGDLAGAEHRFQQNLILADEHNLDPIRVISWNGLGTIADARNQSDKAIEYHKEAIENSSVANEHDAVADLYSLIGIYARSGDQEKSRLLIGRMKEEARRAGRPYSLEQIEALEAYASLTFGRIKAALTWAMGTTQCHPTTTSDRVPQIRARILLADGSEAVLMEADQILQRLLEYFSAEYVWCRRVEALVLRALVQQRLGMSDAALTLLAEAVQLAMPKGGLGLFVGYGEEVAQMLRRLERQPKSRRSAGLLLAALDPEDVPRMKYTYSQNIPEPLTERELDILTLLAARFSNKEIAQELIVSPHTVRNHTANIYGKLQVDNRRQAVERARELSLLPEVSRHLAMVQ